MSIKVTVAVLSSVALGAVGIGGGFLYERLTKLDESSEDGSGDGLVGQESLQGQSEASGGSHQPSARGSRRRSSEARPRRERGRLNRSSNRRGRRPGSSL